jgi:hypothetical protein
MRVLKLLQSFILSCFLFSSVILASEPTTATELEDAPECAISCFAQLVDKPTLSDQNKDILCHNNAISNQAAGCTLVQCSMRDLFDFLKIEQSICGRPELDNDHNIRGLVYSILGMVVVLVVSRIVVKMQRTQSWGADDITIIAAAVFTVVQCIMMGLMTFKGLGRNIWLFDDKTITTFYIVRLATKTIVLSNKHSIFSLSSMHTF